MLVVVVLHALWRKEGKSGENLEYQGLSALAMTFKQKKSILLSQYETYDCAGVKSQQNKLGYL